MRQVFVGNNRRERSWSIIPKGAGLEESGTGANRIGSALDDLMGTWSDEEADEFNSAVAEFERIDEELWR